MPDSDAPYDNPIVLRRYPNRRYYDTTRSQYVTLEDIHTLICDGRDVQVVDYKSGCDITAKVLAQIILEQDPPKLGVFPAELLHQLIRSNEPLMHDFVDKYFNQALKAFLNSQRQFERFLRQTLGLPTMSGAAWTRAMWAPFAPPMLNGPRDAEDEADVRRMVDDLREQVEQLRQQLGEQKGPRPSTTA
jgi:polyhydroxyalkanoate synthesis repressor PhaR